MRLIRSIALLSAAVLALAPAPAHASTTLTAPTGVQAVHVSDTGADLWWSHDPLTDQDVVQRNVGGTWTEYARGAYGTLALTGLQPGTVYTFRVYSLPTPTSGYAASPPSAPVTFTTLPGPDTVAPSAPGTPLSSSVTTTAASLVWGESTDNVQVTGYHLQQLVGGAWTTVRTVDAFSRFQRLTGLAAGTSYTYGVLAFDARGNTSARSAPVTFTTLATTATPTCRVQIVQFNPGFQVSVTITNTTTAPVSGWSVGFTLPATAVITNTFGGVVTRSGSAGTISPPAWGGTIAPGYSASPGFLGTASPYTLPESFTLNGSPCTMV
ncbi:cellulose binding domain-containing protein [Dactylosporangium aurantiacum]|uniref:Cellulose binding domain-containing protein n=1 Tax=Dactylosporangium aurantiacum TaxID=35754 RepID=A0A9Q9IMN8_9ACTN|nr:cellulose binding domain-containing protein [Dactylosporangium aurantiacum]MDG6103266.1 cellulose binding domain-containing protein [Dactylosporangium aurantiacum]UWZ57768.1 cellulose binding domain-containing protein [Dactylosporangium aurantiacum]